MKSTYKLYGEYWDHKPTCRYVTEFGEPPACVFRLGSQPTVFDTISCTRSIEASVLLDLATDSDYQLLTNHLGDCDELLIRYDFRREDNQQIINDFIDLNLGKAIYQMSLDYPDTKFSVLINH